MSSKESSQEAIVGGSLIEILARCKPKELMRFLSVSKLWCFTTMRLINRALLGITPKFLHGGFNELVSEFILYEGDGEYSSLTTPENVRGRFMICAVGGGLVGFKDGTRLLIFNPSIRRFFRVPEANFSSELEVSIVLVLDWKEMENKILKFISKMYYTGAPCNSEVKFNTEVQIFRMSTKRWDLIEYNGPRFEGYSVELDNKCYWIGVAAEESLELVCFDCELESFQFYTFTADEQNKALWIWDDERYLFARENSLVLFLPEMVDLFSPAGFRSNFQVYEFDCRCTEINFVSTLIFEENVKPLGFRDGNSVWWLKDQKVLVDVNLLDNTFSNHRPCLGADIVSYPYYPETMCLIDERNPGYLSTSALLGPLVEDTTPAHLRASALLEPLVEDTTPAHLRASALLEPLVETTPAHLRASALLEPLVEDTTPAHLRASALLDPSVEDTIPAHLRASALLDPSVEEEH